MATTVRVTLLRRFGKRLDKGEAEREQQFEGEVRTHYFRTSHIATMRTGNAVDDQRRLPPDLYKPHLEQLGNTRIRLLGFESVGDAAYVQEWMIDYQ